MTRILLLLLVLASGFSPATQAQSLPARPVPFTFVTDQANLLSPADAKKLDSGLRRYADANGTQVVVVTVPSLGGRPVADYARALGTEWGVGQRGKNNGVVVLLSGQERQVTIQAGSGLQSAITPELTNRVINQQMTPSFKQGNYFAGLRAGLNTLMLAANPGSDPRQQAATNAAPNPTGSSLSDNTPAGSVPEPVNMPAAAEPASSGPGMGTLLIGALVIGGGLWLVTRLFRRNQSAPPAGNTNALDFLPNRTPNGPGAASYGGQYPNQGGSSGLGGMGGILATGAAAAAGAYLGNRMASGHDTDTGAGQNFDSSNAGGVGAAGLGAAGTGAAADYFSNREGASANDAGPDYFADADTSSSDYFTPDNSSYDDTSSDDTGGGGFDSTDDNSGSW